MVMANPRTILCWYIGESRAVQLREDQHLVQLVVLGAH